MTNVQNTASYNAFEKLSIIAGWTAEPRPCHRALEAEAMEQIDLAERDRAARVVFQRRAAK